MCLFVLGQWRRNVATEPIGAALELQSVTLRWQGDFVLTKRLGVFRGLADIVWVFKRTYVHILEETLDALDISYALAPRLCDLYGSCCPSWWRLPLEVP